MLKLKFQYFSHLMWRANSLERTPMLGNVKAGREGDNRGWDGWMALPTWWTWVWVSAESWWCYLTIELWCWEDSWESLGQQGNQPWIFFGRTDAEAETPILWTLDMKSWLMWKDPDAGKDWRQEKKGTTEDEMAAWHHWLNGHGFGWSPGVGDGQGGLACCSPWVCKEENMTEQLNRTDFKML